MDDVELRTLLATAAPTCDGQRFRWDSHLGDSARYLVKASCGGCGGTETQLVCRHCHARIVAMLEVLGVACAVCQMHGRVTALDIAIEDL